MDDKEIVEEVYTEAFSRGNLDILDRYVKEDYVNHNRLPGSAPGRAGLKATMGALRRVIPDLRYVIEDLVGEGDRVAVRARMEGTDQGGIGGRPPTGRAFSVLSLAVIRFEEHMVAERWGLHDVEEMTRQLHADG